MKRNLFKNITIIFCIFFPSCATFSTSGIYFHQAKDEVKKKRYDSAYLKLRASLTEDPHSAYASSAAFSIAEYYFDNKDYVDAIIAFYDYIKNYPSDSGVIFADFFIYKISTQIKIDKDISSEKSKLIENNIKNKIFSQPLFFIFTEKRKSFSYRSVFSNTYTAFDYVDKVKVMRNGELFLEISP